MPAYHLRGQLGPQPIQRGGRGHSAPVDNPRQAIVDARMQSMQYGQQQQQQSFPDQRVNCHSFL